MRTMLMAVGVLAICGVTAGCFYLRSESPWGEVSEGAPVADTDCGTCHSDIEQIHAAGPHGAVNIACGQCHRGDDHPDFEIAVNDATCGGCHLAEYQQTALSAHAESAVVVGPQVAGPALRANDFRVEADQRVRFARRSAATEAGRLCSGCHYDGHALSLAAVRRPGFCESCHRSLEDHFEDEAEGNRCIGCHVEQDTTVVGQVVNSHSFSLE